MLIRDLLGNQHKINLGAVSSNNNRTAKSSLHIKARELLKKIYPTMKIVEEVPIPISPGKTVFLDFLLPTLSLIVEVNGQQHYEQSSLFHKNEAEFLKQKKRDNEKGRWAEINGLTLVILPYNNIDNWENILKG